MRFSGGDGIPYLSIDSCTNVSVAVNLSTSLASSMSCAPALCTPSFTLQETAGSTAGMEASTSGGSQFDGTGSASSAFETTDISPAATEPLAAGFFNLSR